jgi:hypothetical protein
VKKEQILAIGDFLTYYYEDLNFIKMFQDFKENRISLTDYVKKDKGTFYSFLIEFKVTRNFAKGMADRLLIETLEFVNSSDADNVDLFAEKLSETDLTRGNTTTSLASKILFLNNPWNIIPMDTLTRKALKQNENKYSVYKLNLDKYRQTNKTIIEECILYVKPLTAIIENKFIDKLKGFNIICENRIIDKLLWNTAYTGSW